MGITIQIAWWINYEYGPSADKDTEKDTETDDKKKANGLPRMRNTDDTRLLDGKTL